MEQPSTTQTPSVPPRSDDGAGRRDQNFRDGRRFGGGMGRGRGGQNRRTARSTEKPEFDQRTLDIARVARVTKGGKRFSFRATIVAGNGRGRVGVGVGKGRDVAQSVQKAFHQAKKHMINVLIVNGTIPHRVEAKYSSAVVIIKPSHQGIKAGGPVRIIAQLAGISGLTGKLIERTNNKINIARATIEALKKLKVRSRVEETQLADSSKV